MNAEICFIYVTTETKGEAVQISHSLIREKLIACANIIEPMHSLFWWEGAVVESTEAVLILKTSRKAIDVLVERIKDLHSYDCPCIAVIPIEKGNPDYLKWIKDSVHDPID